MKQISIIKKKKINIINKQKKNYTTIIKLFKLNKIKKKTKI